MRVFLEHVRVLIWEVDSGVGVSSIAVLYFVPSGIRRIGSGNVHCLLCILVGLKKLMDNILFSIKLRTDGAAKIYPSNPLFSERFFMVEYHLCQYAVRK